MVWKRKIKRIVYILTAVAIGSGIVLGLSVAGDKSKGPIETLLVSTGKVVDNVEKKIIIEQRENKRSDKLEWFAPVRKSVYRIKHTKMILFGASDSNAKNSFETIINLEDSLHTTFPLIHIYCAWGSKPEERFPVDDVTTIYELGSIPVITWEPWLSDFDEQEFPGIPKVEERENACLAQIAKGLYDKYIYKWAEEARDTRQPLFLRVGHEMNDPYRYPWGPQNNKPAEFVDAWKHIHDIFVKMGALNVIWVWSPHLAYGYFDAFYPGSDYVDYIGTGVLNYGTVANWSKWWTFDEIFGSHYAELAAFKKPIMITEFGSLNVGGKRSKWFSDALENMPAKYPAVKSVIFFHYSADKTTTDKALNWYIKNDRATRKAIINQLSLWPDSVKQK